MKKSKRLSGIKQQLTRAYPELADKQELDQEIRNVLDECNLEFGDDVWL
jgi:division protein CdvB (Snf7/Vps24/ESCRT-III family)